MYISSKQKIQITDSFGYITAMSSNRGIKGGI